MDKQTTGWVFYDGDCPFCTTSIIHFQKILHRRGFQIAPLQTPWVVKKFALPLPELLHEMRVLTGQGQIFSGAKAVVYLAGRVWWAIPLVWFAKLPGGMFLLERIYRWIARNRMCASEICQK